MTLIRSAISSDNFLNICRVCLEEKPESVNLNSIMEFQNIDVESIAIVDILQRLTAAGVTRTKTFN